MAVHTVRATGQGPGRLRREIAQYMDRDGFVAFSAGKYSILGTGTPAGGLVPCPACGAGQLRVVRSPGTGKRFMGCTNFYGGCTASSPLYQRARLRGTKTPCAVVPVARGHLQVCKDAKVEPQVLEHIVPEVGGGGDAGRIRGKIKGGVQEGAGRIPGTRDQIQDRIKGGVRQIKDGARGRIQDRIKGSVKIRVGIKGQDRDAAKDSTKGAAKVGYEIQARA